MNIISSPHKVKARKTHRCDYCGKLIEVGEEYTVSTYAEDSIYDWHECERCKEYVIECWHDHYDVGEEMTQEQFLEFMFENHPDVLIEWRAMSE